MLYIGTVLIIIIFLLIAGKRKNLSSRMLAISFLLLWLIATFRNTSIGLDTSAYLAYFQDVSSGRIDVMSTIDPLGIFIVHGFEGGFKIYNYAVSLLTNNFTIFLAITYAFIYFSFYKFIKKYSPNILMSTIIYITIFFFGSLNYIRESIALAIITWGFKYIQERKFFRYLLIVALATLIHQASAVMILPYFLYGHKVSTRIILAYVLGTLMLLFAIDPIINFLAATNPRYEIYLEKINSFKIGSYIIFGVYTAMLTLIIIFYRKSRGVINIGESRLRDFYLHMIILATLISLVSIKVNAISRIMDYFMIFTVTSIPYFLSRNNTHEHILSIRVILIILLLVYVFSSLIFKPELLGVWPYQSIAD